MKKNILLLFIFLVHVLVLSQWFVCRELSLQVHYSSFDLQLRLIEDIHNDQDVPIWLVRVFHNKVVGTLFDTVNAYIQFWNILFLASFISLAGVLGVTLQFYRFFITKKKQLWLWVVFFCVLLSPFLEIFHFGSSLLIRLLIIGFTFIVWSLLGYRSFLQGKKLRVKFILGILLLSLWYHFGLGIFSLFCTLPP